MRTIPFVALAILLTSCASAPIQSQHNCPSLEGEYALDPQSCRVSQSLLDPHVDVARLPDGSSIAKAVIGIAQQGCGDIGFVIREESQSPRTLTVSNAQWTDRALVSSRTEWSNLPPPIQIGAHGTYFWRIEPLPQGDLRYTSGYSEKGLFLLVLPFHAAREVSCELKRR